MYNQMRIFYQFRFSKECQLNCSRGLQNLVDENGQLYENFGDKVYTRFSNPVKTLVACVSIVLISLNKVYKKNIFTKMA